MKRLFLNQPKSSDAGLSAQDIVKALYQGLLGRQPEPEVLESLGQVDGAFLAQLVQGLSRSDEFRAHTPDAYAVELPDLTALMPERYYRAADGNVIYAAQDEAGVRLMERMIVQHRYYDSFVAWRPAIDLDKRVTAGIVQSLGATRLVELGCFSGSVLKVLDEAGVSVTGVDISHRAFLVAHPSIYHRIRFGDLLDQPFAPGSFDAFLAMDILEHLSPIDLEQYVARIASLIGPEGFAYVNSPMFGDDDVFGTVFSRYVPAWNEASSDAFWFDMHCDDKGWPMHGHLVWATPQWWETLFRRHGLIRDRDVERVIQAHLAEFFSVRAPARKSLFVLRPIGAQPMSPDLIEQRLREIIDPLVAAVHAP